MCYHNRRKGSLSILCIAKDKENSKWEVALFYEVYEVCEVEALFKFYRDFYTSAGSITVEAEAAVNGTVTVFDKPGFVDGFVVAEIYSEKQKVGEAIMVFPVFGSDSYKFRVNEAEDRYFARRRTSRDPHYRKETVKIRGICLNCGEQGKNYTVKFVPGDLWIMEQ